MRLTGVTVSNSGDSALRVVADSGDRERDWRLVHGLARHLDDAFIPGVTGSVPTYDSLLIEFDALETSRVALSTFLEHAMESLDLTRPLTDNPRLFRIPVVYGGDLGPDLDLVAEQVGLSAEEVIAMHHAQRYVIRCLGAPGGSPMVDGPPFPRPVSRLDSPRVSVPQGAVSVAGRQATITPAAAPGGWPLIGRTPLAILDLGREPLVPYAPGDLLEFHPITQAEYDDLLGRALEVSDE